MWNTLQDIHEGSGEVKMVRIGFLTRENDFFGIKHGEYILDVQVQFSNDVNHLASLGEKYS